MKRTSPIWRIPKDQLTELVKKSKTFSDILKFFGLKNIGGNFRTLKNKMIYDNIDFSHIPQGIGATRGRSFYIRELISDESLFTQESKYPRKTAKKRILNKKLIEYKCYKCGLGPIWNGERLTLILDHINGIRNDHRLTNLRFVCPNCDQQSDTFGAKNIKYIKPRFNCSKCGKEIVRAFKSGMCHICSCIENRVVIRPSKEELTKLVWEKPTSSVARDFGVSDKAVSKWCKKYGIEKPGVGYWAKLNGVGNVLRL